MLKILISLALSVFLGSISYSPKYITTQMKFVQHDILFDNSYEVVDSDWGGCHLTFIGSSQVMYFNLFIKVGDESDWQVENIPVVSRDGEFVMQTTSFNFDLMVPAGKDVKELYCTYRLTHEMQEEGWWENDDLILADVEDEPYIINSGIHDNFLQFPPKAEKLVGGKVEEKQALKDFENQESGLFECVPVAVSNCLKHLNTEFKLNVKDEDISVDKLKKVLLTNTFKPGTAPQWPFLKKEYLKSINAKIETLVFNPNPPDPKIMERLMEFVGRNYVIEMCTAYDHCVSITALSRFEDKSKQIKYSMDLTHDTVQGKEGGRQTETVIYNPKTNRIEKGPAWALNKKVYYFIVQAPFDNFFPDKATPIIGKHLKGDLNSFKAIDADYWIQNARFDKTQKLLSSILELETTAKEDKYTGADFLFSVTTQLIPGSYAINVFNFKTNQWDVLQSNIPAQNNQNQALRAYLTKDNVNDYISDEKKIKVQLTSTKKENFDRVLTFAVNYAEFILYR